MTNHPNRSRSNLMFIENGYARLVTVDRENGFASAEIETCRLHEDRYVRIDDGKQFPQLCVGGETRGNTLIYRTDVTWNPRRRKWYAEIQAHGHGKHLGSFNTAEDASQAYKTAAALHHQQYRRSSASFPKGATMTAGEYRDAINALKLTQVAAGAFLGVAPRTSRAWALGERPVPQAVAMLLRVMLRFGIEPEGCGE